MQSLEILDFLSFCFSFGKSIKFILQPCQRIYTNSIWIQNIASVATFFRMVERKWNTFFRSNYDIVALKMLVNE